MNARTFIGFMLLLIVLTTGLLAFASRNHQEDQKNECPAGKECTDDTQVQAADSMIWESVSRHLISAVQ